VEGLSLDEAYLDVTENAWGLRLGREVAKRIKQTIHQETGLTASAGVAPNKFLAKIASGWKKPDGLTVISPERMESFLCELPVDALWGVGPVTTKKLESVGITKLVQVRTCDRELLRSVVGSWAEGLVALAHGRDDRPVITERERKSVGSETTFDTDLSSLASVRRAVDALGREVGEWLTRHDGTARTVTLKVRYSNFDTITRSATQSPEARTPEDVAARALGLVAKTEAGERPIRLLGVSLHGLEQRGVLVPGQQLTLFP
jgi:DNA polymerase-4